MGDITPFVFSSSSQPVRVVMIDDEPWFVAADVCSVLGIGNVTDAASRLDRQDQKTMSDLGTFDGIEGLRKDSRLVNESGLYDLILDSRKPEARAFRKWIINDVIPSIRKTGSYGVTTKQLSNRELALMVIAEADRADKAELGLAGSEKLATRAMEEILAIQPGYLAWQKFMSAEGDMDVANAAKVLSSDLHINLGRDRLFEIMGQWRWIFRQGGSGRWVIRQPQVENGRLRAKGQTYIDNEGEERVAVPQVRIRPKGFEEIYRRLSRF
jgi:anti-repressor protein